MGQVVSRSKYLPLHMTVTEPFTKSPLSKFQETLKDQSKQLHYLSQKILTEAKNPKLYPHTRDEAEEALKNRKTPQGILK